MLTYPAFDPVALQIGPVAARWYGLMYAVGFATAWWLGRLRAARPGSGWTAAQVDDLITWLVVGVVLGGRLGYVIFYDPAYYLANPLESFSIWRGGMSFHGGVAGVVLVCWLYGGINPDVFLARLKEAISVSDFLVGLIKAPFMALVIGIVASVQGLEVRGSTESLGLKTTDSVVKSIFLVIVLDGLFAVFFASIGM